MMSAVAEWYLRAMLPPDCRSATIRMDHRSFVVGRQPGLNLSLNSPYVSERHAEFTVLDDRVYVTDLDSRNGTFVNGKRVRRAQLGVGDLLLIGDIRFRLDRESPVQPVEDSLQNNQDVSALEWSWLTQQFEQLLEEEPVSAHLRPHRAPCRTGRGSVTEHWCGAQLPVSNPKPRCWRSPGNSVRKATCIQGS
jgi:pSer/pThr/pTyr-binding forkhead associated (FHA) protein